MDDTRVFNWLFPNQPGQPSQGLGGIGQYFGFGPGQGQGPPGPPPGSPGFGAGAQQGPPPGPPPSTPPIQSFGQQEDIGVFAVDPGAFYGCLYRYTYVRLENGRRFWFWPTFIGRRSVAGYRWRPRQYRWVYMGIDTNQIRSFQCR